MPVMDGIAATGRSAREFPEVEVLALTSVLDDGSVVGAVKAGATRLPVEGTRKPRSWCRAIKAGCRASAVIGQAAGPLDAREVRAPRVPDTLTSGETECCAACLRQGRTKK